MRRAGWTQGRASAVAAGVCFMAGLATVLSFNHWADWHPLAGFGGKLASATFFDVLDELTSNVLLPLGGLGLTLFAGWVMPARVLSGELGLSPAGTVLLRTLLRYVAPAAIIFVAIGNAIA